MALYSDRYKYISEKSFLRFSSTLDIFQPGILVRVVNPYRIQLDSIGIFLKTHQDPSSAPSSEQTYLVLIDDQEIYFSAYEIEAL